MLQFLPQILRAGIGFFSKREERKAEKLKRDFDLKKSQGLSEQQILLQQNKNANTSWKDEFWTLILAIPMICAFVPLLVPYVHAGFDALKQMPDWYQYVLIAAICTSFGIRTMKK